MIRKFKLYGRYYAIDTSSLAVHKISELQYDMLRYLSLPFESSFPSDLRYDLAKYESEKLSEAYMELASFNRDGVFLSDFPLTVPDVKTDTLTADNTIMISESKFVFASEVIRLANSGVKLINVAEDVDFPVKKEDYDILYAEYERIAKEIIKRKTGRVTGEVFTFIPFILPFSTDSKGCIHIADSSLRPILETEPDSIKAKCVECGVAASLL